MKHNTLILLLLTAGTIQMAQAKQSWPFMDFDDMFDQFDQEFERHRQHMRNLRKGMPFNSITTIPLAQISSNINENDTHILITIKGLEAQELDARLNDENNILTITTPDHKIEIALQNNYVQIQTKQEHSPMNKNDKDEQFQFYSVSNSVVGQAVAGEPQFGNQSIDYDPENKDLIIAIPKQIVAKGKSVPITIKNNNKPNSKKTH